MVDDIGLTVKEILDRIGLGSVGEEINVPDPVLVEYINKLEAESLEAEGYSERREISVKGHGQCFALSGKVHLEYSGQIMKKFEGDAVILIKPDNSLLVHGTRGLSPVSYMARANDIRFKGKEKTLTLVAATDNGRLEVSFLKINAFSCLFKDLPPQEKAETAAVPVALTDEEKIIESGLKKLRIDLARSQGITFLPAVFDNRIIHQLIRQRPKNMEDLKNIKGFGAKRSERYGESVLGAINALSGETANASGDP